MLPYILICVMIFTMGFGMILAAAMTFSGYAILMGSAEHALDVSDTTVLSDFDCSKAGTGTGTQ